MTFSQTDLLLLNLLNLRSDEIQSIYSSNCEGIKSLSVTIAHPVDTSCPICGFSSTVSIGYYVKHVKLANDAFRDSLVSVRVPRRLCYSCHHSSSFDKHLTPANHNVSYDIILKVMQLLQNPDITFSRVAELTGLSVPTVVRIFDKHCHITRGRFPEVLCIDEVYTKLNDFRENNRFSKYSCVFYDFYNHQIVDILPSRTKNHLHHYFQAVSLPERLGVNYVVIDMHRPYKDIASIYFKKATICVDSFHVIKLLNDSLNKLRIRIMKSFLPSSQEYYLLKKWNYLLFDRHINLDNKGKFNKKLNRFINLRQLRDLLLDIHPQLRIAWQLKEMYSDFNSLADFDSAPAHLHNITQRFFKADIPEYRDFCTAITNWRQEIINSFICYKGLRVNNGIAESINSRISTLLFNTRGIRDSDRRRKRIMYAVNRSGFSIK